MVSKSGLHLRQPPISEVIHVANEIIKIFKLDFPAEIFYIESKTLLFKKACYRTLFIN